MKCTQFEHYGKGAKPRSDTIWNVLVPPKPRRHYKTAMGDPRTFTRVCSNCLTDHLDQLAGLFPDARIQVWRLA